MTPIASPLARVTPEAWGRLAETRIFFGHQSVGFNMLDGVRDVMKEHPEVRLTIVENATIPDGSDPVFAHFRAGTNTEPVSKIGDFAAKVRESAARPDIAFLKFCYVDANGQTDVKAVFDQYRSTFAALKAENPGTVFVHLTMPLTAVQTGWKVPIKKLIGRAIDGYADNLKRHEFNELMRAEYRDREPLFDIAAVESTRADGSRVEINVGGKSAFALAPEYTYDGGHLNETGRRIVAEALLAELARAASER